MKKLLVALLLLMAGLANAQKQSCNCPPNEFGYPRAKKADTVFHLSNGKSIALCGYRNTDIDAPEGKNVYSEFVLAVCGEKQVIKFWGAVLYCRPKVKKDTLFVETLVNLPTGKNMAYKWTVWTTEPIYFKHGKVVRDFRVNRQIPKYNEQEIQLALKQYEQAIKVPAPLDNPNNVNNVNMEIADKLFISAISGSHQARSYLKTFRTHFGGLSGHHLEEYDDVMIKLALWDTGFNPDAIKLNNSAVALIMDPPIISNKGDTSTMSKLAKHNNGALLTISSDTTWRQMYNDTVLYEKAIDLLNNATQIDSNYSMAYLNKFNFEGHLKRYMDALATGKELIRLFRNDGTTTYIVGMAYERAGDTLSAKQYYNSALVLFDKKLASMDVNNKRYKSTKADKALDLILLGRTTEAHDILQELYNTADEKNKWQYKDWMDWTRSDLLKGSKESSDDDVPPWEK